MAETRNSHAWRAHLPAGAGPDHLDLLAAGSLPAAWRRLAEAGPDRPALWAAERGWRSRGELEAASARVAGRLRRAGLAAGDRVLGPGPERRRRAWLDAGPQAAGKAGAFAAESVTRAGPMSLVDDAGRMASELVASALRHTDAPVELTVDAGGDVVRIEVRDDDSTAPGTGKVVSFELRQP